MVARTNPEALDPHDGLSAFLFELDRTEFNNGDFYGKFGASAGIRIGFLARMYASLVVNRIDKEGEGSKIAMSCLDNGRYTTTAGEKGLIRSCLETSLKYEKERQALARKIGKFQLVLQRIAYMVQSHDAARLLYLQAGWMKKLGLRNTREKSLAKWFATDASFATASEAIQVHCAYGYSEEYDVERFLRNARGADIYEDNNKIHQIIQSGFVLEHRKDTSLRCELPRSDMVTWQET